MTDIIGEIRQALENRLATTPSVPDIAWENLSFEPTTDTSFIKPSFRVTSRRPAVRGINPQHRYQGLFSMLVYCPENEGPGVGQAIASDLIDRFDSTTDISFGGIIVSIDYTEQAAQYSQPPWYITPVNVAWYIYS